ncbi:MAG: GNAT family N-acetyltransferase [Humibacillus sp.]
MDDPFWLRTERLDLRRPTPAYLDDYVRLHTDPRTYAHSPAGMPDASRCAERLDGDVVDWARDGLGYAAVIDRVSGEVIGWAGLRRKDTEPLAANLYYRLAHDRIGGGLGRELARALVSWAAEHEPDLTVTAMVDHANAVSARTAEGAGLRGAGTRQHADHAPGSSPMLYFVAPTVRVVSASEVDRDASGAGGDVTGSLVAAMLDLWVRVNDAGGSVGFLPGAARDAVSSALEHHLDQVRSGRSRLCVLQDPDPHPDAALRGFAFCDHHLGFPHEHVAVLGRLMVDPDARGRNLGRILLSGLVGTARRELPHVELLRLDYRGGQGLGSFYRRAGWTEVGRIPDGLLLSQTDRRDDVTMVRRVDGRPLR